jgi:hypothetical protein
MGAVTRSGKAFSRALAGAALVLLAAAGTAQTGPSPSAQEPPPQDIQRPSFDYMSTFFRGTDPLGIKEDPAARRILNQGPVPWAVRAGSRHILD